MQGAPKRQVNAEEMLAELKRALEASARAPNIAPALGSRAAKSSSRGQESRRVQRSMRPGWRSWKLTAGGLALVGAAAIWAGFVFMNQAAPPKRELAPAEALVKAQSELAREHFGGARARGPAPDSTQAEILQAGKLARPSAGAAPANSAPFPVREAADADAPNLAAFGLESPPPIFAPPALDQAPALAPDGEDRAGRRADCGSAHSRLDRRRASGGGAEAERKAAAAAPKAVRPEAATNSAREAEAPAKPDRRRTPRRRPPPPRRNQRHRLRRRSRAAAPAPASPQPAGPKRPRTPRAPSVPASTGPAPKAETPDKAATAAASPTARPEAKIAAAPSAAASTDSAPQAETPKPKAAPAEHASNEFQRRSTTRIESMRKPPGRASAQRLARSAKASAKPLAEAKRRSTELPARPKEAERAPGPAQGAGAPAAVAPAAVAPAAAPSAPQRFADGVTHAFGYLVHLPGALVSHATDPNAGAH